MRFSQKVNGGLKDCAEGLHLDVDIEVRQLARGEPNPHTSSLLAYR